MEDYGYPPVFPQEEVKQAQPKPKESDIDKDKSKSKKVTRLGIIFILFIHLWHANHCGLFHQQWPI